MARIDQNDENRHTPFVFVFNHLMNVAYRLMEGYRVHLPDMQCYQIFEIFVNPLCLKLY